MKQGFVTLIVAVFVAALGLVACGSPGGSGGPLGSSSKGTPGPGPGGGPPLPPGATATLTPTVTPTPVMPVITVLAGGVVSSWMGLTQIMEVGNPGDILGPGPAGSTQITVPCDNPAPGPCNTFGRTPTIRLTHCLNGTLYCLTPPTMPTPYLARGRIDFDLKVDVPLSEVMAVIIYWGNVSCLYSYTIPVTSLSNSFSHYSVPINSFTGPGFNCYQPRNTPFQVTLSRRASATGAGFAIDNVAWSAP